MNFSVILALFSSLTILKYAECAPQAKNASLRRRGKQSKNEESDFMTIRGVKIPNKIPDWDRRSPIDKFTTKLNDMISKNGLIRRKFICVKFNNCEQVNKAINMLNKPIYRLPRSTTSCRYWWQNVLAVNFSC